MRGEQQRNRKVPGKFSEQHRIMRENERRMTEEQEEQRGTEKFQEKSRNSTPHGRFLGPCRFGPFWAHNFNRPSPVRQKYENGAFRYLSLMLLFWSFCVGSVSGPNFRM